nr:tetratricopeptide repeat protein [Desulfobulbaceae bacterium]
MLSKYHIQKQLQFQPGMVLLLWKHLLLISLACTIISCSPPPKKLAQELHQDARRYYDEGNYIEATAQWQKLLALAPEFHSEEMYINQAEAFQKLCQISKTQSILQKAVALYPKSTAIKLAMAKQDTLTYNLKMAESTLDSLAPLSTVERLLAYGDLYIVEKNFTQAEQSYRAALKKSTDKEKDHILCRLAISLLSLKKDREAELLLKEVSDTSLRKPEILFQVALFYRIQGNISEAEANLQKAIEADPNNLLLKKNLAELFFFNENYRSALAVLENAHSQQPQNPIFSKFLIEVHLRLAQFDESLQLFKTLEDAGAIDVETYLLKGKYYLLNKEPDFAVSMFSEAVKKEPKFPLSHYLLSVAYLAGGHQSLARQNATKALSLDPNFTDAELLLANIFFLNEEFATSLQYLERVKEKEPENYRSYLLAGQLHLLQGSLDQAREDFENAGELNSQNLSPSYYSIQISEHTDINSAAEKYRALLDQGIEDQILLGKYLNTLKQIGGYQKVQEYIDFITSRPQISPVSYLELGKFFFLERKFEQAENHLQKTLEINPENYSAYFYLAELYEKQNQWQKAIINYQKTLQLQPTFEAAALKLAELQLKQLSVDSATQTLQESLAQNPTSPHISNNLACLYLDNGINTDDAFILAQKAYDLAPDDPAIADTLGWAYLKKQNFTRAKWLFEEALSQSPNNPIILFHLAKTYEATLNVPAAQKYASQAVANGLEPGKLIEAQAIIDKQNN